ncbi:MAG: hypothetical protein ACK5LY_03360 [Lachnospirales bacterium]
MDSLQNIEKSIFISEFSLREKDLFAIVPWVIYKTMALRLLIKTVEMASFFHFIPCEGADKG